MALIWPIPGTKADWKLRSDVLFHFFAYQHFSHMHSKDAGIDLVNLTDGDVQFYNRTYDNIKGLQQYGKLAVYLDDFTTTHPSIASSSPNTHRALLISHIRTYNKTTTPRRRFYMLNLSAAEIDYLCSPPCNSGNNILGIATDGLLAKLGDDTDGPGRSGNVEADRDEDFVGKKVLDWVIEHKAEFDDDQYVGMVEGDGEAEDEDSTCLEALEKLGVSAETDTEADSEADSQNQSFN